MSTYYKIIEPEYVISENPGTTLVKGSHENTLNPAVAW